MKWGKSKIKSLLKKELIILLVLVVALIVFWGAGNRLKKEDVCNSSINIFASFLEKMNVKEVTDEVKGQEKIISEYCKMRERRNTVEYTVNGVTYVGPEQTMADRASVFVKNNEGHIYKYNIYKQNSNYENYQTYMAYHGCSVCALTTLLNATVPELEDYTPDKVIMEIQKETFGEEVFRKNYDKPMAKQMPVTMYGITQILEKYGIEYKFEYEFTKKKAITEIKAHLEKGNPVLITLRRKNGNTKWAGTVHTLLLIGLDEEGNAIVCDSANKSWSGKNQRIKFGKIEELVKFMWSSSELSTSPYYSGRKGTSGYILVY